jgi:membrane protease YdiL (CAAX protease family)
MAAVTGISLNRFAQHPSGTLQASAASHWGIMDAAVIGAVWYVATIVLLDLSMFAIYSSPSLQSTLRLYHVDTYWLPDLVGLFGGILFAGPVVMWIVRKRKIGSFRGSIQWPCSNRVAGWALLAGFALGIGCSLAKGMLLGSSSETYRWAFIIYFVASAALLGPATEEIYFRGILFVALTERVGKLPSIVTVTLLFSLIHPRHFLTVLPIAILLAGMRLYTGSVRACFACHATYNLSLLFFMLPIRR